MYLDKASATVLVVHVLTGFDPRYVGGRIDDRAQALSEERGTVLWFLLIKWEARL